MSSPCSCGRLRTAFDANYCEGCGGEQSFEDADGQVEELMQRLGLGYPETEALLAEGFEMERIYGSSMCTQLYIPTVETNGTVAGSITLHNVFEVTCAGGGPHAYGYYIEFVNPVETGFDRQRVWKWTMQGVVLCVDKIATYINTDSDGEYIVLRQANEAGDSVADGIELLEDEHIAYYEIYSSSAAPHQHKKQVQIYFSAYFP